jgi:hypothetical protein
MSGNGHQILAKLVGIWRYCAKFRPASWDLARTVGFLPNGRDPAVLCQIPTILAGFRSLWLDFDHFDLNLVQMARFQPFSLKSENSSWNSANQCRNLVIGDFSPLMIFSYEPNTEKYFQSFVENIVRRKLFYVETNRA